MYKPSFGGILTEGASATASRVTAATLSGARAALKSLSRIPFSRAHLGIVARDMALGLVIDKSVQYAGKYNDWIKENQSMISLLAVIGLTGSSLLRNRSLSARGGSALALTAEKRPFWGAHIGPAKPSVLDVLRTVIKTKMSHGGIRASFADEWFEVSYVNSKLMVHSSRPEISAALLMVGIGNADTFKSEDESVIEACVESLVDHGIAHLASLLDEGAKAEAKIYLSSISTSDLLKYPYAIAKRTSEKFRISLDVATSIMMDVQRELEVTTGHGILIDFGNTDEGDGVVQIGRATLRPCGEESFPIHPTPGFILTPECENVTAVFSSALAAVTDACSVLIDHYTKIGDVEFYRPKSITGIPTITFDSTNVEGKFEYLMSRASLQRGEMLEGNALNSWAQFVAYRPLIESDDESFVDHTPWRYTFIVTRTLLTDKFDRSDITALDDDYAITWEEIYGDKTVAKTLPDTPVELAVNADLLSEVLFGGTHA